MPSTHTAAIGEDGEVMAAVDSGTGDDQFLIADITCDDAWLSTPLADAASLAEQC